MATSLTRDEMVEIIRRGESVLIHGYGVIARVQDLPSEAVLAAGDPDREDAALAALEAQLQAKQEELEQAREAVRRRREGQGADRPPLPPTILTGPPTVELPRKAPQGPPHPPALQEEGLPAACSANGPGGALLKGQQEPPALAGTAAPPGDATAAVSPSADTPPGPPVPWMMEEGHSPGADRAVAPAGPAPETSPPATSTSLAGADQGGADQDDTLAAAVTSFAAESLDIGEGLEAPMEATFDRWVGWCAGRGLAPSTPQHFGRALRSAVPGLEEIRPRTADGGRERRYRGVSLKETAANR
jgi:hypothetical protein